MNLKKFVEKTNENRGINELKRQNDILENLAKTIENQNELLKSLIFNNEAYVDNKKSKKYVLRTLFLKELLDDGYISDLYAKDIVADNIRAKTFNGFLALRGVYKTGEYLSQIKKLYRYCCERGVENITEKNLYDFQHHYGNETHSVRHSAINYFKEYLKSTPYHGGVNLIDEDLVHISNDRYSELKWCEF